MSTVTVIRRGAPIRDPNTGKVTGFERGTPTTVNVDPRRRTIITGSGQVINKTTRTVDKSGTTVIAGKSKENILKEIEQKNNAANSYEEQTVTLNVNMVGAIRKDMPFSVEGQLYNPETTTLEPTRERKDLVGKFQEFRKTQAQKGNKLTQDLEQTKYKTDKQFFGEDRAAKNFFNSSQARKTIQASVKGEGVSVNRDVIKNEKVALFIENKASQPFVTAAELTFLKYAGKSGVNLIKAAPSVAKGLYGSTLVKLGVREAAKQTTKAAVTKLTTAQLVKSALLQAPKTLARTPQAISNVVGGTALYQDIGRATTLTQDEAKELRTNLRGVYAETLQNQAKNIADNTRGFQIFGKETPSIQSIGFGLSTLTGNKQQFLESTNRELSPIQQSALLKERKISGQAEIFGLLSSGVQGERAGRSAQAVVFGNTIPKTFKQGFIVGATTIAPAGFVEATSGETVQQYVRGEKLDTKRVALAGAVGTGSAAAFGGSLVGFSAKTGKSFIGRKGTEIIGNIADPFEYPSDKITDILAVGTRARTITITPAFTQTQTRTKTQTQSRTQNNIPSFTQTTSKSVNPSVHTLNFPQTFSKAETKPLNFVPSMTRPNVPSMSFTQTTSSTIPTIPQSISFTNTRNTIITQTNVPAISITQTNVPTTIVNWRLPVAPMSLGLGGGGGDFGFGKGTPRLRQSFAKKPTVYSILRGTPRVSK